MSIFLLFNKTDAVDVCNEAEKPPDVVVQGILKKRSGHRCACEKILVFEGAEKNAVLEI